MASSWESFIAASTSAAPAHTSVSATPSAAASPGGGPATLPVAPPPQQSYSTTDNQQHQSPQPTLPHLQYQTQPHPSQPPYQGIRVTIPQQGSISSSGPTTPTPQTPGSGPPPSGAPVHETDLPPEMLVAGWRKFWSKREQRIYFWNRATGESLWDMPIGHAAHGSQPPGPHLPPPQQQQYDPISDPLGIQNPTNGSSSSANNNHQRSECITMNAKASSLPCAESFPPHTRGPKRMLVEI